MANPPKSNTGPFGIPPGGPWFIFQATGTIQRQSNPVLATGLANSGWVGFATQAEAQAALKYSKAHGAPSVGQATTDAGKAITSNSPLAGLFQANIWIRVGQVALGLLLIAIGTAQLTHAVPIATTIAKAVK